MRSTREVISYRLLQDNSIDVLEDLSSRPDEQGRYRVIVTSPPYYGHRHYGADPHEIDQEQTSEAFIQIGHRFCNMRRSLDGEWKPLNSNEILDVGIKNS